MPVFCLQYKSIEIIDGIEEKGTWIKKGDKVGTLEIYNGKTLEKTIDLVAQNDLNSFFGFLTNKNIIKYSIRLVLALVTLFILFLASKIRKKKNIKKRKSINTNKRRR